MRIGFPSRRALLLGLLLLAWWGVPFPAAASQAVDEEAAGERSILGHPIPPASKERVSFLADDSFIKDALDMHVLVARGARAGPTLCLTAAVHGDEVNGVEIARRVFDQTDVSELSGTLVVVPIVNVWGFRSGSRYLADRRDLNRAFPGDRKGSLAGRIAALLFDEMVRGCDALVDLHTGSGERANLPQIRVDFASPRARQLAEHFEVGIALNGVGPKGSLRRAANDAGIAAILYEAGGPIRFEREEIERGIEGVNNVMEKLDMVRLDPPPADPRRIFWTSSWVRSPGGGIFLSERQLGERIEEGDLLGTVTDPLTSERVVVSAPFGGTLVGMAHPQVVLPGFGLFHIAGQEQGPVEPSETEE